MMSTIVQCANRLIGAYYVFIGTLTYVAMSSGDDATRDDVKGDMAMSALWTSLVLTAILVVFSTSRRREDVTRTFARRKKVLLVIAHPDDETMFFSPSIVTMVERGVEVFVLCLSTGNFDGLGETRRSEIVEAAKWLGIDGDNITVVDDARMKDGMGEVWDPSVVSRAVDHCAKKHGIDVVLTFDDYGVSGHPNHVACYRGVLERHRPAWILLSTGIMLKYSGPLGVLFVDLAAFLCSGYHDETRSVVTMTRFDPARTWGAMQSHQSQFVWYRRLFVIFSHFAYTNSLLIINP